MLVGSPISVKGGVLSRFAPQSRAECCGSASTRRTFSPWAASAAAMLVERVVLPTPPFWLSTEIITRFPSLGTTLRKIVFTIQVSVNGGFEFTETRKVVFLHLR